MSNLNPLHIIILEENNGKFNPQGGLFTLQTKTVKISVKEYEEEKQKIEKKYAEKTEQEKNNNNKTAKALDDQHTRNKQRLEKDEISMDTYNANARIINKKVEQYELQHQEKKTKDGTIPGPFQTKLNNIEQQQEQEIALLNQQYSTLRWVSQIVGRSLPTLNSNSFNEAYGLGEVEHTHTIEEFLVGGGFIYTEPFLQGTIPQGKSPHGIFFNKLGTPKILTAIWADPATDQALPPDQKVAFGSALYLCIYTQDMYGHNIEIALKDKDRALTNLFIGVFNGHDDLNVYQPVEPLDDQEEPQQQKASKFIRAVDVQESEYIYADAKTGEIVNEDDNDQDGKWTTTQRAQQSKFIVYIDPLWKNYSEGGQSDLDIYPVVYYKDEKGTVQEKKLEYAILKTSKNGTPYTQEAVQGNQVATINQVETNFAHFHPCGYTQITAKNQTTNKTRATLFQQGTQALTAGPLTYSVVVADQKQTIEIIIELTPDRTDHCKHKGTEKDHTGKVIISSKALLQLDKNADSDNDSLLIASVFLPKPTTQQVKEWAWLPSVKPKQYPIKINTCRFQHDLILQLYPDIEYEVGFKLKAENPFYTGQTKAYTKRKYLGKGGFFDKKTSKKIRKDQREYRKEKYKNEKQEVQEGRLNYDSFELIGEYSFGGIKQAELNFEGNYPFLNVIDSVMWVVNTLGNLCFKKESQEAETELSRSPQNQSQLEKRKKNHNKYLKKAGKALNKIPLKIEIDQPAFAGALAWKFEPSTLHPGQVGTSYALKFKADPLIGIKGRLDLLFVASKIPYVGVAIQGITRTVDTVGAADDFWNSLVGFFGGSDDYKIKLDVDYYVDLFASGELKIETTTAKYHTLDGFVNDDMQIQVEFKFGIECGGSAQWEFGEVKGEAEFTGAAFAFVTYNTDDKTKTRTFKYEGLYAVFSTKVRTTKRGGNKTGNDGEDTPKPEKKFLIHDGFTYEWKID